ncbi:MAG: alpha/beta hydrolase family protein [Patescibacteria group bacterium]
MQQAVELAVGGRTLRGMLHVPAAGGRCPVAAIYHGFTGQRMEPHFIMVKLSRALAAAGIASVRFDFGGSGESDGEFAEMTLTSEVAEAKAILDYARALPFADPSRAFLVGLSMGGAVASVVAGDEPDKVRAIALWSAAGNLPELFAARQSPEGQEALARLGRVDLGGLWLGKGFLDDLAQWDIYRRAAPYRGRVLLLHGGADETVPLSASERYREIYGGRAEMHVIAGADHTFNRCDWEEEVIGRTVEFFTSISGGSS